MIGTGPASFTDPGATDRSGQKNLTMRETDNAIVRDNLIGFASKGVELGTTTQAATGWQITGNEIRGNGLGNAELNGVSLEASSGSTLRGNLIAANANIFETFAKTVRAG